MCLSHTNELKCPSISVLTFDKEYSKIKDMNQYQDCSILTKLLEVSPFFKEQTASDAMALLVRQCQPIKSNNLGNFLK